MTTYQHAIVDDSSIFYREAGPKDASTILLLHGFPKSSPHVSVVSFPFWPITSMWSRPIAQALASRMRPTASTSGTRLRTLPEHRPLYRDSRS